MDLHSCICTLETLQNATKTYLFPRFNTRSNVLWQFSRMICMKIRRLSICLVLRVTLCENMRKHFQMDDFILASSITSTVLNAIVIITSLKIFKKSGDTMHIFILNLTLGDMILTGLSHPVEVLQRKNESREPFNESIIHEICIKYMKTENHDMLVQFYSKDEISVSDMKYNITTSRRKLTDPNNHHNIKEKLVHFANWIGTAVSGLSLVMLNFDKLLYFRWPLQYDIIMSKRKAITLCIFIWLFSIGFITLCWDTEIVFDVQYSNCSIKEELSFYEIFLVFFCVSPIVSSFIVSIHLFRFVMKKRKAWNNSKERSNKYKIKSIIFIFATTIWSSFSLIPYRALNLARKYKLMGNFSTMDCCSKQTLTWLAWCLVYLLTINPILNPFITSLIYKPYRSIIKKLLFALPETHRVNDSSDNFREAKRLSPGIEMETISHNQQ